MEIFGRTSAATVLRPAVLPKAWPFEDFQPWLNRVANFPEDVVYQALVQNPRAWLDGEEGTLRDAIVEADGTP